MQPNPNIELSEFPKNQTSNTVYVTEYQKIVEEKYENHVSISSDGSMRESGVGAAAVCEQVVKATCNELSPLLF